MILQIKAYNPWMMAHTCLLENGESRLADIFLNGETLQPPPDSLVGQSIECDGIFKTSTPAIWLVVNARRCATKVQAEDEGE